MTDGKGLIDKVEDGLVTLADKIGGPEATTHEKAALEAGRKLHLAESLNEIWKADAAAVVHITGHDRNPLQTPVSSKANAKER